MNEDATRSGGQLEKVLRTGQFAVTAELGPPKSADPDPVRRNAEYLKGVVDAVNITDNQTAIVRMSSIAAGVIAMQCGLEPVVQITCRDRNRLSIQSDVLGASALGVHNILCLAGDHQSFGNHPGAKNVYDMDSIQLVAMLRKMRDEGLFQSGDEIRSSKKAPPAPPKVLIGAAANPFADPFEFRVLRLAKKVKAGADFVQTQCIYDMDRFEKWMAAVRDRGLHQKTFIMAGITPLKSARMAEYMRDQVAGLSVPDDVIERIRNAEDPVAEGQDLAVEQMKHVQSIEGVSGVHVMAIGGEKTVAGLVERAGLSPRPKVD